MNEDIPQRVKDALIEGRIVRRHGATTFLLSLKPGEIRETDYKGNSLQGIVTSRKSLAFGLRIRTCHHEGKRYVYRLP